MKKQIKTVLKRIIPEKIQTTKAFKMMSHYKYMVVASIALFTCLSIAMTTVVLSSADDKVTVSNSLVVNASSDVTLVESYASSSFDTVTVTTSEEASASDISSKPTSSNKNTSHKNKKPTSSKNSNTTVEAYKPSANGAYQYNTNLNIEDNVFMDSLIYTGYNMKKHRADGKMWTYILAKYKRGYGWLSDITYAGGSTGLETKNGKPDISYFERNGLVCASFATYVYFNYLPNVVGIDTSVLPRPENTKLADSWYKAVQQWVKLGYSKTVDFKATRDPSTNYINFSLKEEIPIGSIIIFRPYSSKQKVGSHVVVYAGYKNGLHWVYHVGTKNGPEMCAVERMLYGPEPQWPMMVVTTPSNIRMAAALEVELKDDEGKAIPGVEFSIKNTKTGAITKLGKTDKNGKLSKEGLNYGEYTLVQASVPNGYTAKATSTKINLATKNNSKNTFKIVNLKNKPTVTSTPSSSITSDSSEQSSENVSLVSASSDSSDE